MKNYGENEISTVRQKRGQRRTSSRKFETCHEPGPWRRPDRICGECIYGEPYVHPGGIYCVVKCHKSNGTAFHGFYERACWQYRLNPAVPAFMQSRMEEGSWEETIPRSKGRVFSSQSVRCGQRSEDEELYPF